MIKTIKKIDLQGNEIWQDVIKCNRCKKILDPYESEWVGYYKIPKYPNDLYVFDSKDNPIKHICEDCQKEVEAFLEGKDLEKKNKPMLKTFEERVDLQKESLQCESTPALKELRNSCMCSVETAAAIDSILRERQL